MNSHTIKFEISLSQLFPGKFYDCLLRSVHIKIYIKINVETLNTMYFIEIHYERER